MAKRLTDDQIEKLKPGTHTVPQCHGLYVRVKVRATKFWVAKQAFGKQVWREVGDHQTISVAEACEAARPIIKAIVEGKSTAKPSSFEAVANDWFKRHVDGERKLRSGRDIRACLDKHILPAWKNREFESVRRGDVTALLDNVEDGAGPVAADRVLAILSRIFNWYARRTEGYDSPIVRGMQRSKPAERARMRILDDDEIRAVWKAAEGNGQFGAFLRLLLLTGQRREKVSAMRWADISDGVWSIPSEDREKGNAGVLELGATALDIIKSQPRINDFVFAGRGNSHFSGYSKAKGAFDAKCPIAPWALHDLRRTARSLMSRAGVISEHAERVLGHAIKGVEGVYDRHAYRAEKAEALRKLAGLIELIANPPAGNVVKIAG